MKKLTLILFISLFSFLMSFAQIPDIRIKTKIFEKDGDSNTFTLVIGAAEGKAGFADIKCSGGNQTEAEIVTAQYDSETGALVGTNVSCQVDEKGIVEVFCDEGVLIDYFSCTGAEITSIEFKHPEAINILALEHNILEQFDMTPFTGLQALYLNDNPMNVKPLTDSGSKPELRILELSMIENIDPDFDIVNYPNLRVFDAMSTHRLMKLTPSACPGLQKLSIDNTSVAELDVTRNPELIILNISESSIKNIDLSKNAKLQQFFATHSSASNTDIKLTEIDVTHNPDLFYLFLNGNNLTTLDVSKCPALQDLYVRNNLLTSLDLSQNTNLINVFLSGNKMDFNTLPIPQETWGDYDITQRPLYVPASVLAGSSIDLSKHLVRSDGAETYAMLFLTDENDPYAVTEVDPALYSFADGVLTVNEVLTDSVYASFYNGTYPDTELATTRFLVKDASSFDKPNLMAAITTPLAVGAKLEFSVGLANAKVGNQHKFFVDLGDGNLKEFYATTSATPSTPNVTATKAGLGAIKIYMPEGETLTALKIENISLTNLNLDNAMQLAELTLTNTQLKQLDLKWNRLLEKVDITGNNFGAGFTLEGANGGYGKNILTHINLSNNNMTEVTLNQPGSWRHIDLSHNKLTNFNFTDADYVDYLDLSHNDFEYLKINYLGQLKTFYCNDNRLSELVLPETNVIETLHCQNNRFTLVTMPDRNGLDEAHFLYAPQADIDIPTKGPGYNLSEQNVTVSGNKTVFTWKTPGGKTLTEGVDYTNNGGATHFNDNTIGEQLYCEISNASFPALTGDNALKTTPMLSAGMPTHLLGEFTTPTGGQEARLSIASAVPNNSLYIDWTGTESLEQYPLKTTYTVFTAKTTAGARVKVWSYEENDNLSVFSLSNATIADVDLSPMKNLVHLTLGYAGINDLKWPESPKLRELSLDGCRFTKFDFSRYPELEFINFDNNLFMSVDLTGLGKLGSAGFSNNNLVTVKFGGNNALWNLALGANSLNNIDFSGAPNIEQLFLNDNKFSQIDLTPLKNLRILYLDGNRFDFNTLPVPQDNWMLYTYGGQPEIKVTPVDGVVDLSSQAERNGVATTFTWFYGYPSFDYSTGEIVGEGLIEGEEYKIVDGKTVFLEDIDKVCCVLTNPLFPQTYLQTNVFSVTACTDAIESVATDGQDSTVFYNLQGQKVNNTPHGGIFIVNKNGKAKKVLKK